MSERAWYRSIYWRIAIGFILFLAVMLIVQGGLFLWVVARNEGALPSHSLIEFANVIASDVGNEMEQDPHANIGQYVRDHYSQMSRAVFVMMSDGRFFGTRPMIFRDALVSRANEWLASGQPPEVLPLRSGRVTAFSRLFVRGKPVGIVAVQPGGASVRILREIVPTMLVMAGVLMLGGTGLAALLVFRPVNRRLKGVEQAARQFGAGDLTARAPVGGGDEITAVARAFNQMADDLAMRAKQLQEADRARRQLFADVSHELMTPLTAIRGYLETLEMPAIALDAATRGRYLSIVQEETQRLERIVGDLLDLARLEAGGGSLSIEDVAVGQLFSRVLARHEHAAREKGVTLTASGDQDSLVRGDRLRLEQVLQNLAANALRHTPPGGRVELCVERRDDALVLRVSDSGAGIDAEHLPHVFDRFYKVDASRSEAVGTGSGLGLSIAKAIVERHGGTISVRSQPGVETAFEITLPDR